MTALLSRVISPRERGLYMGMQQTYGGVARAIAPLFFGWSFDKLGVSSPFLIASIFILGTIFLSPDVSHVIEKPKLSEPAAEPVPQVADK